MSNTVHSLIALGSNLGDRLEHLRTAVTAIDALDHVEITAVSALYETAPVGGPAGQGAYLNGAALLETTLAPADLLEALQGIETRLGRDREAEGSNGARPMDLDLLWHGDASLASDALTLPHPRLEERLFVLEPLAEIAPDHVLPGCGRTVVERIEELRSAASEA